MSRRFDDALAGATTHSEAIDAVVDLVCGDAYANADELTLTYEMYVYARHQAPAATLINEWLRRSKASLRRHFAPDVARALDALIEGWPLHEAFEEAPLDRSVVRRAVEAIAKSG
jgi:DNA-binding transcriptional regulator YbjK